MNSSLAEIAAKTGKQPRIIFCLNDQANMACFMCLRGVQHPIFISYHLKFNYSQYTIYKRLNNWMFGCNTHLLKHIKQAILAWSFRQNIILGCYPVFAAISARGEFIVSPTDVTNQQPVATGRVRFLSTAIGSKSELFNLSQMSDVEMCLVLDSRHQSAVRVTFVSCIE